MMYTLRFDVETLIIATEHFAQNIIRQLRFDVETLIIATFYIFSSKKPSCGLM